MRASVPPRSTCPPTKSPRCAIRHRPTRTLRRSGCGAVGHQRSGSTPQLCAFRFTPGVGPHPAHWRTPVGKAPIADLAALAYDSAPYRSRPVVVVDPGRSSFSNGIRRGNSEQSTRGTIPLVKQPSSVATVRQAEIVQVVIRNALELQGYASSQLVAGKKKMCQFGEVSQLFRYGPFKLVMRE